MKTTCASCGSDDLVYVLRTVSKIVPTPANEHPHVIQAQEDKDVPFNIVEQPTNTESHVFCEGCCSETDIKVIE